MTVGPDDTAAWETHRPQLLGLAYRMLGDLSRAEDIVQDAWLRWSARDDDIRDPRAYLVTVTTRLCLNELDSARARREESRTDRLPEPVALERGGLDRLESLEQVSMAFLVMLQRLSPAERAVLLLHEVFELGHSEISQLIGKSSSSCRKLLERARENVAAEKRLLIASREEHARLLDAFVQAAQTGDTEALAALLTDNAALITDGGPAGQQVEGQRNLAEPLVGNRRIAAFLVTTAARGARRLSVERRELNGQPALVLRQGAEAVAALLLGIADGRVHRVYFQADRARLKHLAKG